MTTPEREKFDKWFKDRYDIRRNEGGKMNKPEFTGAEIMAAYDIEITKGGSADSVIIRTCRAILSATPTPPEVEPVYQHAHGGDVTLEDMQYYASKGCKTRTLFISSPSPKAEWSADGEPLNLEAAAEKVVELWNSGSIYECPEAKNAIHYLRKFLGNTYE